MKMKLFVSHALQSVEKELNEWLSQAQVRIQHVSQSQSEQGGKFVFVISVFYHTDP